MTTYTEYLDKCPECGANWIGKPVPEEYKKLYSVTHYRECVGIMVPELYDGMCAIKCPSCKEDFPVSDEKFYIELYRKYKGGKK